MLNYPVSVLSSERTESADLFRNAATTEATFHSGFMPKILRFLQLFCSFVDKGIAQEFGLPLESLAWISGVFHEGDLL